MMMRRLVAVALFAALSAAARAETTYPDCEKFKEPLAYNQCLASHGPSAARALAARADEGAATGVHGFHGFQRSRSIRHSRHGRMSATFVIRGGHASRRHGKFSQM
jgi:hypothetical protein